MFHVESCRLWAIINTRWGKKRNKKSEERVSDVCVHGCSRSTPIYGHTYVDVCTLPGCCTERPTTMFLDAYSCKLTYSELMLWSDEMTSHLILVTCLYVRVTTVSVIRPPYWYVIPPHICYQYSIHIFIYIYCFKAIRRSIAQRWLLCLWVVLIDTDRWLDGLLHCSRYWAFITTIGWCCLPGIC